MTRRGDHVADQVGADIGQAALPVGGGIVGRFLTENVRREWQRNASTALKTAERVSGLTREDLEVRIESSPRLIPLYLRVLWAAGMNGHDKTLKAMGTVLGTAALSSDDDAVLEDAETALQAMGSLTSRHFRVLAALADGPTRQPKGSGTNYKPVTAAGIAERLGIPQDRATQALTNLVAAGLAESIAVWNNTAYPISPLGLAVLEAAHEVADGRPG